MAAADLNRAKAAQRRLVKQVGSDPNVKAIGVAPAAGGYELKVNVLGMGATKVPKLVDGVPVRIAKVGAVRKRSLGPPR